MLARVSWRSVLVAIVCAQSGCAFFGIVPDEGKDDDECLDREAQLVGQWISPQGATTASSDYQLTTFTAGGGLRIEQWQAGSAIPIDFQAWRVSSTEQGTCDQIEMDFDGSGWLAQVWKIHELTGTVLDIEVTDGTYVGPHTRYDWWNGGVPTCGEICDPVDSHCAVGELCLNSIEGFQCLPESCQSCFDGGQSCSWYSDTCAFDTCV